MNRLVEQFFPYLLSILLVGAYLFFGVEFPKCRDILSASITLGAVFTGFLATLKSFWSFAKLRLAKLRGVRWDLFYDHLKETEWRFNHRRDNLTTLLTQHLKAYPLV